MLPPRLKKIKDVPKEVTVLKQDRQAFWTVLSKCVNLDFASYYSLITLPPSIAKHGGELCRAGKNVLADYLIE